MSIKVWGSAMRDRRFLTTADRFLDLAVHEGLYTNTPNLRRHLYSVFGDHDLNDKVVLDVGGGNGLLSFWVAANGGKAVCLEPEFKGSTSGVIAEFKRFRGMMPTTRGEASIETKTFQEYSGPDASFDLIVLANSINHLDESAVQRLHFDPEAQQTFKRLLVKVHYLLKPGGSVVMTDCSRRNFFGDLGFKSPLMPSIEWKKHQPPEFWSDLLQQVGFVSPRVTWSVPNSLGDVGRMLLASRTMSYFLLSHFRIECERPAS
jgi:SAM-dependent methyltransferase